MLLANTEKQKQNYLLSLQNLKYKINVSGHSVVILTDSLQSSINTDVRTDISNNSFANRSEIKQLSIEQIGYELQFKKTKQTYFPTLSFFANYTEFFQGEAFNYSDNFFWSPGQLCRDQIFNSDYRQFQKYQLIKRVQIKAGAN